jgi:peptide/nickel transport system permease protein
MGISLRDARPVSSIIGEAISNTLLLSVCSLVLVFGIAVLINLLITHQDYQKLNKLVLNVVYVLDAIPVFLLAFFLIILLATGDYLQLFPVYGLGRLSPESGWLEALFMQLQHLIIPVTCLTLAHIPYVTSQLQQAMWEVTSTDYITTARAKGVPEGNIVRKHIFRNSLFPLITLFSAFIPALLGGAVVIEVIFAIPGMGRLLVDSIQARDYPVILGIVLVMAFARIAANILADILYYLADPRVTFAHDRRSR